MTAKEVLDQLLKLQAEGHDLSKVDVMFFYTYICECTNYEDDSYANSMEFDVPSKTITFKRDK